MLLHDAIQDVLEKHGGPMTYKEIAEEAAVRNLYVRGDGEPPPASQIAARVNNHKKRFVKLKDLTPTTVGLRAWNL